MAPRPERRGHVRHDIELPVSVRPEIGTEEGVQCWAVNVSPRGMLLECEDRFQEQILAIESAEMWLAPFALPQNEWHPLGKASIVRAETSDSITRVAVKFEGSDRQSLAVPQFVGDSRVAHSIKSQLLQASGCDFSVLITGETGTGKTLAAECIHRNSGRRQHPFIRVNCPNISPSLFESELFGHEKGAFTDAKTATPGFLRVAGEGTLLLDEISEMDPALQAKLLRVLDEKIFVPVGGHEPVEVRCRVIATSNADLRARMRQGTFRPDLFYRLCEVPIEIAPLRDRREDIPLLAEFLLKLHSRTLPVRHRVRLTVEQTHALAQRDWPGNVRELGNCVKRFLLGQPISVDGVAPTLGSRPTASDDAVIVDLVNRIRRHEGSLGDLRRELLAVAERESITGALAACDGNHTRAASKLGISYRTLVRKLTSLNLDQSPRPRN